MKALTQYHIKAIKDLVEMISIGGVVAIIGDIGWVGHDIFVSTESRPGLWAVAGFLVTALVLSGGALVKYHKDSVKKIIHERFLHKMKMLHHKHKHVGVQKRIK